VHSQVRVLAMLAVHPTEDHGVIETQNVFHPKLTKPHEHHCGDQSLKLSCRESDILGPGSGKDGKVKMLYSRPTAKKVQLRFH